MKIEEGIFFKEDFAELPDGVVIYIKKGKLIYEEDKNGSKKKK